MYDKQALIALIKEKALEFGDFTLASGKKAKFYLDCRRITLDSSGANLIADGIIELIQGDWPDAVGGMAIGADPITGDLGLSLRSKLPVWDSISVALPNTGKLTLAEIVNTIRAGIE